MVVVVAVVLAEAASVEVVMVRVATVAVGLVAAAKVVVESVEVAEVGVVVVEAVKAVGKQEREGELVEVVELLDCRAECSGGVTVAAAKEEEAKVMAA